MSPPRVKIKKRKPQGKEMEAVRKELVRDAGTAFDDIVADLDKALQLHSERLKQLTKVIEDLKPAERSAQINKLSQQVEAWMVARDKRWSGLGAKLGTMVRAGVRRAVGI